MTLHAPTPRDRDLVIVDLKRARATLGHVRDMLTEHQLAVDALVTEAPPEWLVRAYDREAELKAIIAKAREGNGFENNDQLAALERVQEKIRHHHNRMATVRGLSGGKADLNDESRKLIVQEAKARLVVAQLTEQLATIDAMAEAKMHEHAIQGEEEAERIAWLNEKGRREKAEFEAWRQERRAAQARKH